MNLWKNRNFTPMLLHEIDKSFDSNDYIFEMKFDGVRALIFASKKEVKIVNRKGIDITHIYPELQEIKNIVDKNTIFDGEIVAFENNLPSFNKIQLRSHLKETKKIKFNSKNNPIIFMAFDVLYYNENLIDLPLIDRKEILEKFKNNDVFKKVFYIEKEGKKLFSEIKKQNIEGIVAKKRKSLYFINERNDNWIKIKNWKTGKFIIGGYNENKSNTISLILGEIRNKKLVYIGNVVLGKKRNLYKKIMNTQVLKVTPFVNYNENDIVYIKPINTCYVKYMEKTHNNSLRQPFFYK